MRYAIGIEYDGSQFLGWQRQRQSPTVQAVVENALSRVADHAITLVCCGRTDTGVHALGQVAHFDSHSQRSERSWVLGVNSHLPDSISLLWIRQVDEEFHARFSAFSRSYRYQILNRWVRPAVQFGKVSWCREPLDEALMHQAAQALLGKHDFTSYRALACQATHSVREIIEISVRRQGNMVSMDVSANGFLYHMVRNIAGNLLLVGTGKKSPDWPGDLLQVRDRAPGAATAPADGLYFVCARYSDRYALPTAAADFPRGRDQS